MSKRSIKFLALLAFVTAGISVFFITCSFLVDTFTNSDIASDAFYYIRTAFDLVAEYTAFAVIIYSFYRYSAKRAWPAVLIALGSFILSALFQIGATAVVQILTNTETGEILVDLLLGFVGLMIERIIPCALIALITFLCTMHGTSKITKFVSLKNPLQRAMLISCLLLYLITAVPQLVLSIIHLISYGGPSNMYAEEFFAFIGFYVILNQAAILVYNLVLQYLVYMLVYYLCQKHEENAPIKKKAAAPVLVDASTDALEAENAKTEEK